LGILISIVAWACTNIYYYYNNRWKIEEVVLLDITMYSQKMQEIQDVCNKYMDTQVKENTLIDNCMRYSKDDFDTYKIMFPEIIKYMSTENITKTMKFYNTLSEYNFLMDSLCKEIGYYKDKQIVIKSEDMNYFKNKNNRIKKIVNIITQKKYRSIYDLPDDYRGMVPPETLVK
jgi:hypothetical protein